MRPGRKIRVGYPSSTARPLRPAPPRVRRSLGLFRCGCVPGAACGSGTEGGCQGTATIHSCGVAPPRLYVTGQMTAAHGPRWAERPAVQQQSYHAWTALGWGQLQFTGHGADLESPPQIRIMAGYGRLPRPTTGWSPVDQLDTDGSSGLFKALFRGQKRAADKLPFRTFTHCPRPRTRLPSPMITSSRWRS